MVRWLNFTDQAHLAKESKSTVSSFVLITVDSAYGKDQDILQHGSNQDLFCKLGFLAAFPKIISKE